MTARRQLTAEIILLRRQKNRLLAHGPAVEPDPGVFGALQKERDPLAAPVVGDVDRPLIPANPFKMPRLREGFRRPLATGWAFLIRVGGSGKRDVVGEIQLGQRAGMLGEFWFAAEKMPSACERNGFVSGLRPRTKGGNDCEKNYHQHQPAGVGQIEPIAGCHPANCPARNDGVNVD